MRPRNQMGFTRPLLYQLKRYYGATVDVYYESSDTVNLETGERAVEKEKWSIRRAICLPTVTSAMTMIPAALKEVWKRNAAVEVGDKTVILDRRDLPKGFRLGTHNYSVVIDRRRYEVLRIEEFEFEVAYCVTLKELAGVRAYEQIDMTVREEVQAADQP